MSPEAYRFATVQGDKVQWLMRRNCSVTPRQLCWMYVSLSGVSLSIAAVFWWQGATLVMPFAWMELLAVGVAFLVYARHAADGEKIVLENTTLVVELERAGRLQRSEFARDWVRVEPKNVKESLVVLSGQGRSVSVGRFLRPELRSALAKEIRAALSARGLG